ncbi:MAG: hypothetical protein JWO51_3546 [Rhodospirillales bacterium]|nr:hypothetical protein [Rhodospirillales bacterium]
MTNDQPSAAERFVSPAAPPEGWPREMLTILAEECAEVVEAAADLTGAAARTQVRVSKALRFGLDEIQPGHTLNNAQRIGRECGDFIEVMFRLIDAGILSADEIDIGRANKHRQLAKFMQSTALSERAKGE